MLETFHKQVILLREYIPKLNSGIAVQEELRNCLIKLNPSVAIKDKEPINTLHIFDGEPFNIYPEHLPYITHILTKSLTANLDTTFTPMKLSEEFTEELLVNSVTIIQNNNSYLCKSLICLLDSKIIKPELYLTEICQTLFSEACRDILFEKVILENKFKREIGKSLCNSILKSS